MRCEEVQTELARDAVTPELRESVESHVASCANCRRVRVLFGRMEKALQRGPVWDPPEGFARRVAARASGLVPSEFSRIRLLFSPNVLNAATLGVLVAAAGYIGARFLEPLGPVAVSLVSNRTTTALEAYARFVGIAAEAPVANSALLAWACAGVSLWVATWFTRRALT